MKRIFKGLFGACLSVSLLFCFLFAFNVLGADKKQVLAAANIDGRSYSTTVNGSTIEDSDLVGVSYYKFIWEGNIIEYYYHGWNILGGTKNESLPDGEDVYYFKLTGSDVYYYTDDPTSAYEGYGVSENCIPCDINTQIEINYYFKSEEFKKAYYFSGVQYKQGAYLSPFEYTVIDRGVVDALGETSFATTGALGGDGYYSQIINTFYSFKYRLTDAGMDIIVTSMENSITINLDVALKEFEVVKQGETSSIVTDKKKYNFYDTALITIKSSEGKLPSDIVIKNGNDSILTLFGGMQKDGEYFYPGGAVHDNNVSYGNYAFAYEAELLDGEITQEEYVVSDGAGFAQIERKEKLEYNDNIIVKIFDSGEIQIILQKIDKQITVDVSEIKYAQINLYDDEEVSSYPFEEVVVNGVQYRQDAGGIPSKLFVVDFDSEFDVYLKLKLGYSFLEDVDSSFITGNTYSRTITGGGVYNIGGVLDENCSININLIDADGNAFKDNNSKIYISVRDITSVSELDDSELSLTSGLGTALKTKIPSGTLVKVYIKISPYYYMREITGYVMESPIYGEGFFAYEYINFSYMVTSNQTLTFKLWTIAVEKDVYDKDSPIGKLKIELLSIDESGIAEYNVKYKSQHASSYSDVQIKNPDKVGYSFAGMRVGGTFGDGGIDFLKYYSGSGKFQVPADDKTFHEIIAKDVYGAEKVYAMFTPELKTYTMIYNYTLESGESKTDSYTVKFYYDSNEMYIDRPVQVFERGKYFAGFGFLVGDPGEVLVLTIGDIEPVLLPDEDALIDGFYMYKTAAPIQLSADNLSVVCVTRNKSYNVNVLYYYLAEEDGTPEILELNKKVEFSTNFSVQNLNTDSYADPSFPGKYNFIGWKWVKDTNIYYVLNDVSDVFDNRIEYEYDYTEDMRLVPVFSAGTVIVSFFDGETLIKSATVTYDDVISIDAILKTDGDYVIPSMHAYSFLGFYDHITSGKMIIEYTEDAAAPYNFVLENGDGLFAYNGSNYVWKSEENINLYVRWDADFLDLYIETHNIGYKENSAVTASKGYVSTGADGVIHVGGFIVTDSFDVLGLKAKEHYYISAFYVEGELLYSAGCTTEGEIEVLSSKEGLVLDIETGVLSVVASDYISEETGLLSINMRIEYAMTSHMVSFSAGVYDDNGELGKIVHGDSIVTKYYLIYYEDRFISSVDKWVRCDEEGKPLSPAKKGWVDLTVPGQGLVLKKSCLYGEAGLTIIGDNGEEVAFKGWLDTEKDVSLVHDLEFMDSYNFISIFSNNYDVTLYYYVFNPTTNNYVQISYEGHFWVFDNENDEYVMEEIFTLNSYEVYSIGGKDYYITAWSDTFSAEVIYYNDINAASYLNLNELFNVEYSTDSKTFRLYAVYKEYAFKAVMDGDSYKAVVDIPNDVCGNSYDELTVRWIAVSNAQYEEFLDSEYALNDALFDYFNYGVGYFELATIKEGESITKAELEASGKVSSSQIIMIIERKNLSVSYNRIYAASLVGQLSSLVA